MIDELNKAIAQYQEKWQALVGARKDKAFFERFKPMSAGWKVENLAEFDTCFSELRDHAAQVHLVWLNERWIATIVLRDMELAWGVTIIKLMQRRPNSTDALGLDHIDFYSPEAAAAQSLSAKEPDLKFTDEVNGLCKWTSVWFDGTEAKLRHESVLDVSIAEMSEVSQTLKDAA